MSRTKVTRKPKEGFFCPVYSDSMLLQEGNIVLKIATILKHKVFFAGIVNGTLEMELSLLWDVSMMLWCWVLMEKNHLSISRPWMSGIPGFVLLFNIYHIWPKPLLLLLMFLSFFFLFLFFLGGGRGQWAGALYFHCYLDYAVVWFFHFFVMMIQQSRPGVFCKNIFLRYVWYFLVSSKQN